jgi:hypothetical protein
VLGGIHVLATSLIIFYATRYKHTPCARSGSPRALHRSPQHPHRPPAATFPTELSNVCPSSPARRTRADC